MRDHEYKRHGTLTPMAGIDLLTGHVHALVKERHRSREFIEFLKLLDAAYLGFLIHEGGANTIPDAAYRFVRHEPGVDVVLFGTGDPEHLRTNIASILKPPSPEPDRDQLAALFSHLVGVGLDAPHLSRPRG
jgi:aryl-alcohol dehydrogenase-like predicted oxidoreductase